jgi:hypothetical protein
LPLSADRALAIRATLSRLVLALRADDRHVRANEIIERLTMLGATVVISEETVSVTFTNDGLWSEHRRMHTQWLLTVQSCLYTIIEQTHGSEGP